VRKNVCTVLTLALVFVISQGVAWSGVTVSWIDDILGPQSVPLMWVPINPGDPYYAFTDHAWYANLTINYTYMHVITFTFTGDYTGDDGLSYPYILLRETIHNKTQFDWTDFHLQMNPVDPNDWKEFGWASGLTTAWNVNLQPETVDFTMPVGGVPISPGGIFYDSVFIFDDFDNIASISIDKWPTPIPEAGSASAVLSGLAGMILYVKRRKV